MSYQKSSILKQSRRATKAIGLFKKKRGGLCDKAYLHKILLSKLIPHLISLALQTELE